MARPAEKCLPPNPRTLLHQMQTYEYRIPKKHVHFECTLGLYLYEGPLVNANMLSTAGTVRLKTRELLWSSSICISVAAPKLGSQLPNSRSPKRKEGKLSCGVARGKRQPNSTFSSKKYF